MSSKPEDGSLLECRDPDCNKTYKTYAGRINHEKKVHNMHRKLDVDKDDLFYKSDARGVQGIEDRKKIEKLKSKDDEEESEEESRKGPIKLNPDDRPRSIISVKKDEDGFPIINRDETETNFTENLPAEVSEGGPIWLLIKSVGRILTLVGDQDYLKALEPVEKELKYACSQITGKYFSMLTPIQQIGIYLLIAWVPTLLMDIPTFIKKFKKIKNGGEDE